MINLILSIVSSTIILTLFKAFGRLKVNTFQAIVVNYIVAASCGYIAYGVLNLEDAPWTKSWFMPALCLGILFIAIFNLMALTAQRLGLSVVSVATKMSVAIPILFGFLYYKEVATFPKLIGIGLALVALYLSSKKSGAQTSLALKDLALPLLVFLGSGVIDTSIKFLEEDRVGPTEVSQFSATIFAAAAISGILLLFYKRMQSQLSIAPRNIIAGIALGIPNYFSIYFLVQALRISYLDSATVFTMNNIAIVILATLTGILLFKERLSTSNWVGIALALVSIAIIAYFT
ncbi:DMT family transporter [Gilvibacter sediminis]|uniref:DMT family transporter n=1 Tax=Gilvibacter sediminis TaxID=379071 RepID=UPI0023510450|nr:DMT family transporter [Gilvibacter sediminis]MDC7997835.1 DMT family transporter [Gilvibacter sediminis]